MDHSPSVRPSHDRCCHGPDAFGGAINIVTSAPATSAFFRIGENDLTGGGASFRLGGGLWLAFLDRQNVLSILVAESESRVGLYIRMGFAF